MCNAFSTSSNIIRPSADLFIIPLSVVHGIIIVHLLNQSRSSHVHEVWQAITCHWCVTFLHLKNETCEGLSVFWFIFCSMVFLSKSGEILTPCGQENGATWSATRYLLIKAHTTALGLKLCMGQQKVLAVHDIFVLSCNNSSLLHSYYGNGCEGDSVTSLRMLRRSSEICMQYTLNSEYRTIVTTFLWIWCVVRLHVKMAGNGLEDSG